MYNVTVRIVQKFCLTAGCNWTQYANTRNQNGHFSGQKSKPTLLVMYGFTCLCVLDLVKHRKQKVTAVYHAHAIHTSDILVGYDMYYIWGKYFITPSKHR